MKRKNMTRNALVTSILALLVCVSMLVGATFAWFTDSVVSGMNTIAAGNLDVELLANGDAVKSETKLFNLVDAAGNDTWWEPGMVVYENLQVANEGTLALKYQMSLNFGSENDLNGHKLSEVLKVAVIDKIEAGATRAEVLAAAKASSKVGTLADFSMSGELEAGESNTEQAVVIFWEPNDNATDNLYNANNDQTTSDGKPLHIEFGVNLQAYQLMSESDSFGPDYDEYAANTVRVKNAKELIDILTEIKNEAKQHIPGENGNKNYRVNVNIVLDGDIVVDDSAEFMYTDSNGAPFHFYGVKGVLDLNGHNITVGSNALLAGKAHANAALLFQYSNVDIVGEGNIKTQNKSIPVYGWANGSVNIYGGNYITNASERNESAVYVNNSTMIINVYGGTYEDSAYAFNAHDTSANAPVIILHKGVAYKDFLKNGTTDVIGSDINNGHIVLAEGTYLKNYENNGETWHQVAKKQEGTVYVSSVDDMRAAMKNPNAKIVLTDDLIIDDDKGTGYALYAKYDMEIDLNGHDIKVNMPGKEFYGVIYALNGAKVNIVGEGGVEVTGGVGPFVWITGGADTGTGKEADGTTFNIYGGNWTQNSPNFSNESYCEGIYANRGGIINIYGGMFDWGAFSKYTVNESREGVINIYGGTFVNFDPRVSHDTDGSYVAEGYTVVSETQTNGDVWYTVVPVA